MLLPQFDAAKVLATEKRVAISSQLREFESRTGWRIRIYSNYGLESQPSEQQLRGAWKPDRRTMLIQVH